MDDLSKSGDRPAHKLDEIEVTPAMIEAGVRAVESWADKHAYFDDGSGDLFEPEFVASVFRAMMGMMPLESKKALALSY
jgi:hypothetical protein